MLNTNDINVAQPFQPAEFGGGEQQVMPAFILGALRRRWKTILLIALGAAAVSVSVIWAFIAPQYEVSALVHVAPVVRPILFADAENDISRQYNAYITTEAQAMVSPAVIHETLNRPEVLSLPSAARFTADELAKRLEMTPIRNTYTLSVSMVGEEPEAMAVTINGLLDVYLRQREAKKRLWDEKILSSLRSVQAGLDNQLELKNAELRELAVNRGVGSSDGSEVAINERIGTIHDRMTEVRQKSALAAAKLEALDADVGTDGSLELTDGFQRFRLQDPERLHIQGQIASYESSPVVNQQRGQGDEHPATRCRLEHVELLQSLLEAREAELPKLYRDFVRRSFERERSEAAITTKVLQAILDNLMQERTGVARQAFMVNTIRHEQERLELALTQVRQKIWNVQVEQNRLARVTIDLPAVAPDAPNLDNRLKFTGVACLLSLFLGLGTALLRDRLDTCVREPREIAQPLGMSLLGSLPYIRSANGTGPLRDDRVLEPMRGISTALLASSRTGQTRSRLITGPNPGSGKSSLALNLARSLASTGRRVLLVDADNQRQGITKTCTMTGRPGLKELLDGTSGPDETVYALDSSNLQILPTGQSDERFGEILSRRDTRSRLSSLFEAYDEVIIDSPPVLAGSDAVLLATLVDEVILVLRAGESTREEAQAARDYLATVGGEPIGVILNAVDSRSSPYHTYGQYAYAAAGDRGET